MSRTRHHRGQKGRHYGTDLWSKRGWSWPKSAAFKKLSKRLERARLKRETREQGQQGGEGE